MPTYERTVRFRSDYRRLSPQQRRQFARAVVAFIEDLRRGEFRAGLRIKGVAGHDGVFEMSWAPDGRATFEYGASVHGDAHIIWRRVGTHEIFREP